MRLGLLLGERRGARNKARDSCTSLASLDAHTLASHNTSPVSKYVFVTDKTNTIFFVPFPIGKGKTVSNQSFMNEKCCINDGAYMPLIPLFIW